MFSGPTPWVRCKGDRVVLAKVCRAGRLVGADRAAMAGRTPTCSLLLSVHVPCTMAIEWTRADRNMARVPRTEPMTTQEHQVLETAVTTFHQTTRLGARVLPGIEGQDGAGQDAIIEVETGRHKYRF